MNEAENAAPEGIQLSQEQFEDALSLIGEADSVELKLTVPDSDQRSAVTALDMDPLEAHVRQIFFFDTPDLALNASGVVVRARRVQNRGDDSVVKLRPVVPHEVPAHLRKSPDMVVEVDAMPGGYVCSASLKHALKKPHVRDVAAGKHPANKLFSKDQRAFYEEHRPTAIELDELSILGPINVLKLKFAPKGYSGKFVAELWSYPDNTRILELSTKCAPPKAVETAVAAREFLRSRGVNLGGEQQTKTKTALEYFSTVARGKPAAGESVS